MDYYFTDPFTGKPITTIDEIWKFHEDNRGKFETFSAAELNNRRLDRIAKLKAHKRNSLSGKPD